MNEPFVCFEKTYRGAGQAYAMDVICPPPYVLNGVLSGHFLGIRCSSEVWGHLCQILVVLKVPDQPEWNGCL